MFSWLLMFICIVCCGYSFGYFGLFGSICVCIVLWDIDYVVDVIGEVFVSFVYMKRNEVEDYVDDEGRIDYDCMVRDMWRSYRSKVEKVDDDDDYYNVGMCDWSEFNKIKVVKKGKYWNS